MRRNCRRLWLACLLIAVVGALVAAATTTPLLPEAAAPLSSYPPISPAPPGPPRAAFIGDSFTTGANPGGQEEKNYWSILSRQFGWSPINVARGDTGYSRGSATTGAPPYEIAQLPAVLRARPDFVFVEGSRNDVGQPRQALSFAAASLFKKLQSNLPEARIFVIGPIWSDNIVPVPVLEARETIQDAAQAAGLSFIDPIADQWFSGANQRFIGFDKVHPIDAGHKRMAELITADLMQLGVTPAR